MMTVVMTSIQDIPSYNSKKTHSPLINDIIAVESPLDEVDYGTNKEEIQQKLLALAKSLESNNKGNHNNFFQLIPVPSLDAL